jgi:hypothetical protein
MAVPAKAVAPMRRLTRLEYNNTVRDLFGAVGKPADEFESDVQVAGFDTNSSVPPGRNLTEDYLDAAQQLAQRADLTRLLPCDAKAIDDACARKFVAGFGKRVFRRPLVAVESDGLWKVFADKRTRSDAAAGVRLVVQALLSSPSFLYRPDVAATDAKVPRAHELASRLSYFLWASMPDDKLFAAADSGALLNRDGLAAEVKRLMEDARAAAALRSFYEQWMDLPHLDSVDKDPKAFPQFGPALKASMREETGRFAESVHRQEAGSLRRLLTSPQSILDGNLARLYGVMPAPTAFAKVELPKGQRSGVLTHAGLMTVHAFASQPSPIHRGHFVRRRVLCQELAPPPGLEIVPPKVDPDVSAKQRLAQHRADAACAGCHQLMDLIGFGFQHYDALGRWQVMEGKSPVDATGELAASDVDGPFNGALALGDKLAGSRMVQECMARQWFRFALGRSETASEECVVKELARRVPTGDVDLREIVASVATSAVFVDSRSN